MIEPVGPIIARERRRLAQQDPARCAVAELRRAKEVYVGLPALEQVPIAQAKFQIDVAPFHGSDERERELGTCRPRAASSGPGKAYAPRSSSASSPTASSR